MPHNISLLNMQEVVDFRYPGVNGNFVFTETKGGYLSVKYNTAFVEVRPEGDRPLLLGYGNLERTIGILKLLDLGRNIVANCLLVVREIYGNGIDIAEADRQLVASLAMIIGDEKEIEFVKEIIIAYCICECRKEALERIRQDGSTEEEAKNAIVEFVDELGLEYQNVTSHQNRSLYGNAWILSWRMQTVSKDYSEGLSTVEEAQDLFELRSTAFVFVQGAIRRFHHMFPSAGPLVHSLSYIWGNPGTGKSTVMGSFGEGAYNHHLPGNAVSDSLNILGRIFQVETLIEESEGEQILFLKEQLRYLYEMYYARHVVSLGGAHMRLIESASQGLSDLYVGELAFLIAVSKLGPGRADMILEQEFDAGELRSLFERAVSIPPFIPLHMQKVLSPEISIPIGLARPPLWYFVGKDYVHHYAELFPALFASAVVVLDLPVAESKRRVRESEKSRDIKRIILKESRYWGVWRYYQRVMAEIFPHIDILECAYEDENGGIKFLSQYKTAALAQVSLWFSRIRLATNYGDSYAIEIGINRLRNSLDKIDLN